MQKRYKRSASANDYAKMVVAASEVVMENRGVKYKDGSVLFIFPHWINFTREFPKGHIVSRTLETNTYKINAVKLLNWLYDNGHSTYNSSMLVKQTTHYELLDTTIEQMFDIS